MDSPVVSRPAGALVRSLAAAASIAAASLAAAAAPPPQVTAEATLDGLARAFSLSPAWRAEFTQRYVPAGFETGATDSGVLTVAPPASLRFEYEGDEARVFATDGAVARYVDLGAATCSAVRIDATSWGRLPLAAILDPGAARAAFALSREQGRLTLTPFEPTAELARIEVAVRGDHLPGAVVVVDGSGNRNEFAFTGWARSPRPPAALFLPALPGMAPCYPEQE